MGPIKVLDKLEQDSRSFEHPIPVCLGRQIIKNNTWRQQRRKMANLTNTIPLRSWQIKGIGILLIVFGLIWAVDAWYLMAARLYQQVY
jgi:extradiol dioxygenase family protein